jgi:hypothetical protein
MRLVSILLLGVLFNSCGKDDDDSDSAPQEEPTPPEGTDEAVKEAADAEPTELEGIWRSPCDYDDGLSSTVTLVVTGLKRVATAAVHDGLGCDDLGYKLEHISTFRLTGSYEPIEGAMKIDSVARLTTITLLLSEVVDEANAEKWAGYNNWVIDEPKIVNGLGIGNVPGFGDKIFNLVKIEPATEFYPAKLLYGDEATGNGDTEATRPKALVEEDKAYEKQ